MKKNICVLLALVVACTAARLSAADNDPAFLSCWKSLLEVEGCVASIYNSYALHRMLISPQCCEAIDQLSVECFPKMFGVPGLDPAFAVLLKEFCHSLLPPPSDAPTKPPVLKND